MRTYKTKLMFGNQEIYDYWVSQLCLVRNCWNFASEIVFNEKIPLGLKPVHHRLYREEREKFPELPAQLCIKVNKAVLAAYRTIRSNGHKLESPARMRRPAIQIDKRIYSKLRPDGFLLSDGKSKRRQDICFLTYPKFDELMASLRPCDPTLQLDERSGTIYACFPFNELPPIQRNEECLGVDLGVRRLATTSDGVAISDKEYLARRRKIRHSKRMFASKKKKSHSARRKLLRLRRKERNISKEMCHVLANEILKTDKGVIVMEDLTNIKKTTSRTKGGALQTKHNNRLSQVPFFQLRQILSYKALRGGRRVETVSPEFTSQIDSRTGSKDGCLRKGCRFYTKVGVVYDADWNAALNIRNRYLKHPSSTELPLDGRLLVLKGRYCQQTNRGLRKLNLQATGSSAR